MNGDVDEREERIRELLPLVKRIARRIRALVPGADVDDLVGDGSIGLIRAVDHFDPSRGPSLEHYARKLIVGTMLNGLRRMDPVSERARRAVREGENARFRTAVERGEMPPAAEVETIFPGYTRALLAAQHGTPLSLDAPLPEGERLGGDWSGDPATLLEGTSEREYVQRLLEALPPREAHVMREHYFAEKSLREISRRMDISPQRASQLHLAAMNRLRKHADAAPR